MTVSLIAGDHIIMSVVDVYWHSDDKQIIILEFGSEWDWDEFEANAEETYRMADTVSHHVVQIFDMRNLNTMPDRVFTRGRQIFAEQPHPQIKSMIMVGLNSYLTAVYRALEKMLPASLVQKWNIAFVSTMDEALDIAKDRLQ